MTTADPTSPVEGSQEAVGRPVVSFSHGRAYHTDQVSDWLSALVLGALFAALLLVLP